jgi:hypothetical protein
MLSVCPPIKFRMAEPFFMKLGTYIMAPELISAAYFINPSHQSVCLYMYPTIAARQRLRINVNAATNTHAKLGKIVGRVVFYAVRLISKECRLSVLPVTSCYVLVCELRSIFLICTPLEDSLMRPKHVWALTTPKIND